MVRDYEDENHCLKDTIFQANRELEKFYEQANAYVMERDEYKRKYAEAQAALEKLQNQFSTARSSWQSDNQAKEGELERIQKENLKTKGEIENIRRQSESMSQAQNETIQALQDAIREKDKAVKVKVLPSTESNASWPSVTTTASAKSTRAERETAEALEKSSVTPVPSVDSKSAGIPPSSLVEDTQSTRSATGLPPSALVEDTQSARSATGIPPSSLVEDTQSTRSATGLPPSALGEDTESAQSAAGVPPSSLVGDTKSIKSGPISDKSVEIVIDGAESATSEAIEEVEKLRTEREEERERHSQEVTGLRRTIVGLEKELENVAPVRDTLKGRVEEIECECDAMHRLVNEAKELNKAYHNMGMENVDQRVRDLQQKLAEKVGEMSEYAELLNETQQKLCWTVCQNNMLKKEITELLARISEYELNYNVTDERTDYCQKEIQTCQGNVTELRDKLVVMKDLLQKKVDQYSQLETEFCVQNNSLCCMRKEIAENKDMYEREVCDLRCMVGELQSKLASAEKAGKYLREDHERNKTRNQNYTGLEEELEQKFDESLRAANEEIATLNEYIAKLQQECANIRKELQAKDQLIDATQARLQSGAPASSDEDVCALRNELDTALRQQDLLRAKNEALCLQLSEMQNAATRLDEHNMASEKHVQKCLCEIHHLRHARQQLEVKNQGYLKEIRYLRCAYAQLYENFQKITATLNNFKANCCQSRLRGGYSVGSPTDIYNLSGSSTDHYLDSDETAITEEFLKSPEFWMSRPSDDFLVSKDQ